jgi:hypothetical protein
MPNGHGGYPFLGAPVLCAILFAVLAWLPLGSAGWLAWLRVALCLLLAALIGWRLAYHLHLRHSDDYGGAYTAPERYRRAMLRYRVLALLYAVITSGAGFAILRWRAML